MGLRNTYEREEYEKTEFLGGHLVIFARQYKGCVVALGFTGKRQRPDFHYQFKDAAHMGQYLGEKIKGIKASMERRAKWREEAKEKKAKEKKEFLAQLKPGVVLCGTWGYEQTNVEFFEVTKVKGCKIFIRELGHKEVEATGWASNTVVPRDDEHRFIGDETYRMAQGGYLNYNNHAFLRVHDGRPVHKSWYA